MQAKQLVTRKNALEKLPIEDASYSIYLKLFEIYEKILSSTTSFQLQKFNQNLVSIPFF